MRYCCVHVDCMKITPTLKIEKRCPKCGREKPKDPDATKLGGYVPSKLQPKPMLRMWEEDGGGEQV